MKCFYHRDTDAVGLCRHCARALCPACAAEREAGLACIGRCEGEVDRVASLIRRNVTLSGERWTVALRFAVYIAGTIILAVLAYRSDQPQLRIVFGLLAAMMFVFSISGLRFLLLQRRR